MKRMIRMVLPLTLLLAIAQPTFAACINCLETGSCGQGDVGLRCKVTIDGCRDGAACFSAEGYASLASEYRIVSVEITPATDAKIQVAEKKTAQPETARIAEARK